MGHKSLNMNTSIMVGVGKGCYVGRSHEGASNASTCKLHMGMIDRLQSGDLEGCLALWLYEELKDKLSQVASNNQAVC